MDTPPPKRFLARPPSRVPPGGLARPAGILLALLLVWGVSLAPKLTRAELISGPEVARRINARDDGLQLSRSMLIEMTDRRGKKRTRRAQFYRKYFGEDRRSIVFYEAPTNVKGTGFLVYDYGAPGEEDDQWLYLPALRRVRRLSASNRGDYFLGTDLTYEDVKQGTKVSLEDYTYETQGESEIDGRTLVTLRATPVDEKTAKDLGYSRVVLRVDPTNWFVVEAQYWDTNGNSLKTTSTKNVTQIQGIWTAHVVEVQNHKTGHHSRFEFSAIDYERDLKDDLFTERTLRRGHP